MHSKYFQIFFCEIVTHIDFELVNSWVGGKNTDYFEEQGKSQTRCKPELLVSGFERFFSFLREEN